jgi:hypothetical protein
MTSAVTSISLANHPDVAWLAAGLRQFLDAYVDDRRSLEQALSVPTDWRCVRRREIRDAADENYA